MNFIKHLNIGKKIYLVTSLLIAIFTLSSLWLYTSYRDQLFEGRRQQLVAAVETAWGIIDHFSELSGEQMPVSEAQLLAKSAVANLRFEGDSYFWINDTQPRMVMHPIKPQLDGKDLSASKDPDGKALFVEMVNATAADGAGFVDYQWPKPGMDKPQPKLSFVKKHPTWNWIVGSGMYVDDLDAEVNQVFYTVLAVLLLAVLVSAGLVFFLARSISKPMHEAVEMIEEMEMGHLNRRLGMNQRDEVGRMSRAMDRFADSLQKEMIDALQKLASGNLNFEILPRDEKDQVRGALKRLESDLSKIMSAIQEAGEQISSGSINVTDFSQSLSQGATESAASLEEIASSLNELSSQTKFNSENANQVNLLSSEAKQVVEEGNSRMERMVAAMGEISDAGQSINKIIKVIDEIAFQTNLLALNAAVEAARAGQHGKGFAVVAEEVRNLAARSAKAAQETADLIAGSVEKTNNGAEIASQTAESLGSIFDRVTKVSDLAEEIAAASHEQAEGIVQINQGLNQIDQVVQQNTATAEESAAAAEQLSSQAGKLIDMIKHFQLKDQPEDQQAPLLAQKVAVRPPPQPKALRAWGQAAQPEEPAPRQMIELNDNEFG